MRIVGYRVGTIGDEAECTIVFDSALTALMWIAENNSVVIDERLTIHIVRMNLDADFERPIGGNRQLIATSVRVLARGWPRYTK